MPSTPSSSPHRTDHRPAHPLHRKSPKHRRRRPPVQNSPELTTTVSTPPSHLLPSVGSRSSD
jgi:hypothetical protein